jgi:ABC-type amino acid transport substrate-binding protein
MTHMVLATPREDPQQTTLADLLLDAIAALVGSSYAAAAPLLRQAVTDLGSDSVAPTDGTAHCYLGVTLAIELWDDETKKRWSRRVEPTS